MPAIYRIQGQKYTSLGLWEPVTLQIGMHVSGDIGSIREVTEVEDTKRCQSDGMSYLTNPIQNRCRVCRNCWFPKDGTPICRETKTL